MTVELDIGRRTDIGRRREHNEDCLAIYHHPELQEEIDSRGTLLIVADGMGGYAAGEVASRTAVEAVLNAYYGDLSGGMTESLTRAVRQANRAVLEEANRDADHAGMGTTLALAVVWSGQLAVANVGDSRVYLIRDGRIAQISRDHSWIAELLAVGKITPEEARHHPMRNVVTRSLGGRPELDIEVYPPLKLRRGDIALVCSDGLWGMVSAEQMLQLQRIHSCLCLEMIVRNHVGCLRFARDYFNFFLPLRQLRVLGRDDLSHGVGHELKPDHRLPRRRL